MANSLVTNDTAIVNKEKLMTHSIQEKEPTTNPANNVQQQHLNIEQVNLNRAIMTKRIRIQTLFSTFIYSLTFLPFLFTLARTLTWPNGKIKI